MDEVERLVLQARELEREKVLADPSHPTAWILTAEEVSSLTEQMEQEATKELHAQNEKARTRTKKLTADYYSALLAHSAGDPSRILIAKSEAEMRIKIIEQIMADLSEQEMVVWTCYYLDGRSEEEIAEELMVSQSWVSKMLRSIKIKIRRRIEGSCGG